MKILAIETATQACSAALWQDGECVEQFEMAPQKHANLILPMVEACFAEAGLPKGEVDALAFGEGPGAFTGIRIAAGAIQGLALGWEKPVIAVSSLEALIWQGYQQTGATQWQALLDARMKEVYLQQGEIKQHRLVSQPVVLCDIEEAKQRLQTAKIGHGIGDIEAPYPALATEFEHWLPAYPRASAIAEIASQRIDQAKSVEEEVPLPVYLRNNVADKPKPQAPAEKLDRG